jgi:HAD superfamily hydrolase (TIGR01509 family)
VKLLDRNYWIFDMDGTLTVAIHDFEAIRSTLGIPPGKPILELLAQLPEAMARALLQRLDDMELELARRATPQPGAMALLEKLACRRACLGIVTRNSWHNAHETLHACGLAHFFEPECILGREAAQPKPSPEGICKLLKLWDAAPDDAVMVGDYVFDFMAGRAAGTATVYVDTTGEFQWAHHADIRVRRLDHLVSQMT